MIHNLIDTLTEREKEVYSLLCLNLTNKEIADRLNLSEHTIKKRLQSIYLALGVESNDPTDKQSARRRAILYSGTKIENTVRLKDSERAYTKEEIRLAAKKIRGISIDILADLISFLEMN